MLSTSGANFPTRSSDDIDQNSPGHDEERTTP
jgi:hypothetical protein